MKNRCSSSRNGGLCHERKRTQAGGAQAGAAAPALLGPVFGIVGAEFVAAFAAVQAQHVAAIAALTATVGAIATTALGTGAAYSGADSTGGADIAAAGSTRLV